MSYVPGPQILPVIAPIGTDWCPDCRAMTMVVARAMAITPDGVIVGDTYSWCETCRYGQFDRKEGGHGRRRT